MGDLTLVSDNRYLLDAVDGNLPIVTYEKKKAKEQRLSSTNFAKMDCASFDQKIGQITNLASTLISMLSEFPEDSAEWKEIRKRIDVLRRFQGDAIDSTKGMVFVPPPAYWNKRQKYIPIPEDADEETIDKIKEENRTIQFNNRICANRKPYFFGYVYDREMEGYKYYKQTKYDRIAENDFGKRFDEILKSDNLSEAEKKFRNGFLKHSPLRRSPCTMNQLAWYVEDIQFDNTFRKKADGFDYHILMSKNEINKKSATYNEVIRILTRYFSDFRSIQYQNVVNDTFITGAFEYENVYPFLYSILKNQLFDVCSNEEELCDTVIYVTYEKFPSKDRDFLWSIFGERIIENMRSKAEKIWIVSESEDGKEYLGNKYKLIGVDNPNVIQKV